MDLLKNVYSSCFSPIDVQVRDNVTGELKVKKVPCGKCYHCMITKVNEWVTRMTIQTKYSKYTYFVTLTYDSANYGTELFEDTDPMVHNINKEKKYMPAPLILCKKHVQDYFKRLRKNTGVKFQYYVVGEYGHNFGRPHYHFLLWSNVSISQEEMQYAWSIVHNGKRQNIGNIDYQNMAEDVINPEHSYKYVCKYLQKREFNFDNLPTKKYHYANFKKNYQGLKRGADSWKEYQKIFSPFFLCSKRPAIGFDYFAENIERFQKRDFRLLELPSSCIFPTYFYRKTRESFCPYKTLSLKNWKPNSFASIQDLETMLVELQNCITFNQDFMQGCPLAEYVPMPCFRDSFRPEDGTDRDGNGNLRDDVIIFQSKFSVHDIKLPRKYFSFYDCKNHFTYHLCSDWKYNVVDSKLNLIYRVEIEDVIKELSNSYNYLLDNFLRPMHAVSEMKKNDKLNQIVNQFGSYEKFEIERDLCIQSLTNCIADKQTKYKLTKNLF